jgi:hypothetical protein
MVVIGCFPSSATLRPQLILSGQNNLCFKMLTIKKEKVDKGIKMHKIALIVCRRKLKAFANSREEWDVHHDSGASAL